MCSRNRTNCDIDTGGTGTWCVVCCRYDTEPSGYRQTQNATSRLMFVPQLDDDNTTLYCVATKDSRRVLVAVSLNVTGEPWPQLNNDGNVAFNGLLCSVRLWHIVRSMVGKFTLVKNISLSSTNFTLLFYRISDECCLFCSLVEITVLVCMLYFIGTTSAGPVHPTGVVRPAGPFYGAYICARK